MWNERRGAVLLEVIVALTIFAVAGLSAVGMLRDMYLSLEQAQQSERELRRADRFFEAVALWSGEDLERRLGAHPQGSYRLDVERPQPGLFEITLTDSSTRRELLHTALYRPEQNDGAP